MSESQNGSPPVKPMEASSVKLETAPAPKEIARVKAPEILIEPKHVDYAQAWLREEAKLAMLRTNICPKLDDLEFEVFLEVCKITRLNPFIKQIYAVKRRDENDPSGFRVTHQTGIDGLRLIAHRTGTYAGVELPEYSDRLVSVSDSSPLKLPEFVDVTIFKAMYPTAPKDEDRAISTRLYVRDIIPLRKDGTTIGLWHKMGRHLLAKCGEAQDLRKGWPAETAGLYITEEMHNADMRESEIGEAIKKAGIEDDRPKASRNGNGAKKNGAKKPTPAGGSTWVPMVAKYSGACEGCGNPTRIGDQILFNHATRKVCHPRCIARAQNANG